MTDRLTAADRIDIQDLLHSYAWALDTGDAERFVSIFAEDAVLLWDSFETPFTWTGHAELRAFCEDFRNLPSTAGRQHHVSNVLVEGSGNEARATAYVAVMVRQEDAPHPTTVMGWYDDAFLRTAQGWKIARHVIRDWNGPVLHRLAGQDGQRVGRASPPFLDGFGRRP